MPRTMTRLPKSLGAWGTPGFGDILKQEIEQLDAGLLPLQQGLSLSSYVTERPYMFRRTQHEWSLG